MAVKLVFEDHDNTPSSILLKSSLYGDRIYFSGGVSQLLNEAANIKEEGDIIFMFYDMSPNNKETVKGYNSLIDTLRQNKKKYANMYVVPIICIEYHVCKMFEKYGYFYTNNKGVLELIDKIIKIFDWMALSDDLKNRGSLEKLCKNILKEQNMPCLRNKFKYDKNTGIRISRAIDGIFYEKDCVCDRKYCHINCTDTHKIKAEKLYSSLPLIVAGTDEHKQLLQSMGIELNNLTIEDIKKERQTFYKEICKNIKLNMIKIHI